MKIFFSTIFFLLISASFISEAEACSCFEPTLDYAIQASKDVVILELQNVEKFDENETGYGYDGIKQSKLIVKKIYKGNLEIGQTLTFAQGGGGDCIWTFSEKKIRTEFLFFLDQNSFKKGFWRGFACSRSGSIESRGADIKYLNNYKKFAGKSRLSGTLRLKVFENGSRNYTYKYLDKVKVEIVGNGKNITVETDENGVYEIYDLPAGKYKVSPETIKGYLLDESYSDTSEIKIDKDSLEEVNFYFSSKSQSFSTNESPFSARNKFQGVKNEESNGRNRRSDQPR